MNYNNVTSSSAHINTNGNNNNNNTENININSYTNSKIQLTEPWSIPRPTLSSSGSSSNSSQISNSTPASLNRKHRTANNGRGHRNLAYQHEGTFSSNSSYECEAGYRVQREQRPNSKLDELKQRFDDYSTKPAANNNSNYKINGKYVTNIDEEQDELATTPKRGSRSSQGSSDSNNSSHSASSGSLLLTVANLENFAKIHQKKPCSTSIDQIQAYSIYNTNITLPSQQDPTVALSGSPETNPHHPHHLHSHNDNGHTTITMDRLMLHQKTKDLDALSIASSTHFTVVNGMGGPQRVPKSGLCSRGHQITVLIVTMSIIFLLGISAAVFMLEMRARDMPK